jgi:hypothetical protein
MSYLLKRVARLEQNEGLIRARSPMARLLFACDEAALRLAGRNYCSIQDDKALAPRILQDLEVSFIRKLSDDDLATLISELEAELPPDLRTAWREGTMD